MTINISRRMALAALGAVVARPSQSSETWPARSITLVIGVVPGGAIDAVARIIAEGLSTRLDRQVVVESKPGAAGTLAAGYVARTAPDGYTLLAMPGTHATTAAMYRKLPYRVIDDFSMIGMISEYPFVMVTYAGNPIRTLADLIGSARMKKTPLLYGTPGVGSTHHLALELFARMANIKLQHIPYRGGAPAITDLLGRQLDFLIDTPATLLDLVRDGKLHALAVTGGTRLFSLPDIPTISEAGVPGYVVTSWQGLAAPAGLPLALVERLNAEIANVLAQPTVAERLARLGNSPRPMGPNEFKARIEADIKKWMELLAGANIDRI
jgi:tripartite-type tricarboxylate transporter receptor subunit TctC